MEVSDIKDSLYQKNKFLHQSIAQDAFINKCHKCKVLKYWLEISERQYAEWTFFCFFCQTLTGVKNRVERGSCLVGVEW